MTENSLEQGQVAAADIALSSPEIDSRLDAMLADMDAEDAAAEENTAEETAAEEVPNGFVELGLAPSWFRLWPTWATPSPHKCSKRPFLWPWAKPLMPAVSST
jgi:hypothetical protein